MIPEHSTDTTALLLAWSEGDLEARDRLMPIMYDELRSLARLRLRSEAPGHTLNPTAVVHELFMKLVQQEQVDWQCRSHFLGTAANMIRRILVDHARIKKAAKRGGGQGDFDLDEARDVKAPLRHEELLLLDLGLSRFAEADPRAHRVVELRFFGGLQFKEIGELVGISERTAKRDWKTAQAWLGREIAGLGEPEA